MNWKVFGLLLLLCGFSLVSIIPYNLSLIANKPLPVPLNIGKLLGLQILQGLIFSAIFIYLGLWLAPKVGLGTPLLTNWVNKENVRSQWQKTFYVAFPIGICAGIIILGADAVFNIFWGSQGLHTQNPAAWKGFLAAFYGAIYEEILIRFFFMTLIIWALQKISNAIKKQKRTPKTSIFWVGIVTAALIFGALHLPMVSIIVPLSPLIIGRILVLNGIGGLFFGWLYWKNGLEAAMIAHFAADLVLHVFSIF